MEEEKMILVNEEFRHTLDIMKDLEVGDEVTINERVKKIFLVKEISVCFSNEKQKYETCSVCKGRIRLEDLSSGKCDVQCFCYSYGCGGFPFIRLRKNKLSRIFKNILEEI